MGGIQADYRVSLHSYGFFSPVWYKTYHKKYNWASGLFSSLSMSSSLISAIMICHHKIYLFVSHQFTWSSVLTQVIRNRKGGTYMVISTFHLPRTISTFIFHDRYLFQIFFETPVMEIPQPPWQNCALVTLRKEFFSFVCFNAEHITSFAEKEKSLFPS